ncbi:MAG: DUF1573 domain-containing protein [Planctomycetota bacterium]
MRLKYKFLVFISICTFFLFETVIFSQRSTPTKNEQSTRSSLRKKPASNSEKKSSPAIKFDSTIQDLGEINTGFKKSCEFKFTNTGDGTLNIKKVTTTCGCTSSKLEKKVYAPGESGTLKITYNANKVPTKVNKKAYVTSNDPKNPKITLTITGQTVAKVEHSPSTIQLLLNKENAGCPEITLKSRDKQPFSVKRLQSTRKSISAELDSSKKQNQHVIQPKVDKKLLQKIKNGRITIIINHPECKQVSIPFKVVPEFNTKPAGITLLQIDPEKPISRELWVLNNYEENFEIESITSKHGYAKVTNQEENGSRHKIDLEITPPLPSGKKKMFQDKILIKIKNGEQLEVNCVGVYPKKQVK